METEKPQSNEQPVAEKKDVFPPRDIDRNIFIFQRLIEQRRKPLILRELEEERHREYEKYKWRSGKQPNFFRGGMEYFWYGHSLDHDWGQPHWILDRFFDYGGLISFEDAATEGVHYNHAPSGIWFLRKILNLLPEEQREKALECIDLLDPLRSIYRLAEMKICKGIKLAEEAGLSYARLCAILGGEGRYSVSHNAGVFLPLNLDECPLDLSTGEIIVNFPQIGGNNFRTTMDDASKEVIFGESRDYDIYMAVNHGDSWEGDKKFRQRATYLLKKSQTTEDNAFIIYQQPRYYTSLPDIEIRNKKDMKKAVKEVFGIK